MDFDNWESMGNIGWSYENVLPYFIKSENNRGSTIDGIYYPQTISNVFFLLKLL